MEAPMEGEAAGPAHAARAVAPIKRYLDLGSAFTRELSEGRYYRSGWRDDPKQMRSLGLEPSKRFRRLLPDPSVVAAMPELNCCYRYCHTALNKVQGTKSPVNVVRWSPEGRWLITGSQGGEFTLWNGLDFSRNRPISGHERAIRSMTWSRAGDWLVSGGDDASIRVWNTSIRKMAELQGHNDAVRGLCFSPQDTKLGSCSDDVTVKIWDFKTRREEVTMKGHGFDVKSLDWHLTKGLLVSGSRDTTCKLWSPREGKCVRTVTGHTQPVSVVSFHPTCEDIFLSTSKDCTVRVHDLRMLKEGAPDSCIAQWKAHDMEIRAASWHPTSPELLVTGSNDGSLAFWIVSGGLSDPARQAFIPKAHESEVWDVDWNPLGHVLASGSNDRTAKFWARPRPGDSEADLYKGYERNSNEPAKNEADFMRANGAVLPMTLPEREKLRQMRTPEAVSASLVEETLPGLGRIGDAVSEDEPFCGILLAPPQDSAKSAVLAVGAAVAESRRAMQEGTYEAAAIRNQEQQGHFRAGGDRGPPQGGRGGGAPFRERQQVAQSSNPEDFPKPRYRGVVKKWDEKGFGFIAPFDRSLPSSIFSHASNIVQGMGAAGEGPEHLDEGSVVEFSVFEAENRKNAQMQTRASHIIDKRYFQPGFVGADEPSSSSASAASHVHTQHHAPPQHAQPPPHYAPVVPQVQQPQPPQQQLNPEFVAHVRGLYESGQVEYLKNQLATMNMTLEGVLPMVYGAPPQSAFGR